MLAPGIIGTRSAGLTPVCEPLAPMATAFTLSACSRSRGVTSDASASKSRDAVDLAFALQAPPIVFDALVTIEDTTRHKPHPEPVLLAIARLGASPADAVYVGDAPYDIEAARAAGCAAVGVTWGAASAQALHAAGADAVATSPAELAGVLLEAA